MQLLGDENRRHLQGLLESIKSSDVLETRISLISQLIDSYQTNTSDIAVLIEWLVTFWEDSTCFSTSNCLLNKAVLCGAAKYLESDISNCVSHFLILGTKASIWCRKHLQVVIVTIEDSRDEQQSNPFPQLILDTLSFSYSIVSNLIQSPNSRETVVMLSVETFMSELLSLTKSLIFEGIHSIASEVIKAAQLVLDSAIKLCRAYFQMIHGLPSNMNIRTIEGSESDSKVDYFGQIVNMTAGTIQILYELGIFAASGGGNLVTILNVSWKGVVCLLQLNKGILAEKVNIGDIILSLVSLANETLRCASEAWFSTLKETPTVSDVKRTFLPIKFYLINAVRISSEYSSKAFDIHSEISRCLLSMSSSSILFSKETHLRAASEAVIEFIEPTSILLLNILLGSVDVKTECKLQILDWLFAFESDSSMDMEKVVNSSDSLNAIITIHKNAVLILGRVVLISNLLKSSSTLKEEIVQGLSAKLDVLLNALTHEDVYSAILSLQIPVSCASGGPNPGITWQHMYSCVLHSLKTFLIVASSSKLAWSIVETFFFGNLLHPHFLCLEIVRELLCFVIRHAEIDVVNHVIEKLCTIFKAIASSGPTIASLSSLRKIARSICCLLTSTCTLNVDQIYAFTISEERSSVMLVALLLEGFPLDLLSDDLKVSAIHKIVTAFYDFIENNPRELGLNGYQGSSDLTGLPVLALSSALRSCKIESSKIIDDKNISQILKFAVSLIRGFRNATDGVKDHYVKVLTSVLDIISTRTQKQLHMSDELKELIMELQTLFVATSNSDTLLYQIRPSLASFMVSLSDMEIADNEGNDLYSAILSLHHILLKERHWAFTHLAISSFASFAASTSFSQLWRFIPNDAALSFDIPTGKEADEGRFMDEFKAFLEKEVALKEISSKEQVDHLHLEGIELKKLSIVEHKISSAFKDEKVEVINEEHVKKKRRKLPDGVCEGMELIQNGLKAMNNALAKGELAELKDMFLPHISCLEDVISQLVGLSDKV